MLVSSVFRLALLFSLLVVAQAAFAQSPESGSPYVSRLRTDIEGSAIKLLWQDSNIAGAKYVIYRNTAELTTANLKDAEKLAVVPAGQQSYVDRPTDKKSYFYAVLVENPSGKVSDIFIPFRNVTTEAVSVQTLTGQAPAYADVTGITDALNGRQITLSFKSGAQDRELVVYRSTSPIKSEAELLGAVSVGVIPSSQQSFDDTPVPGIPYYYAIIDSAMLADGKVTLAVGQNTTAAGLEVPIQTDSLGQVEYAPKRPRPLPFLTLNSNLQTGAALPGSSPAVVANATPLTSPTTSAVDSLLGSLPPKSAAQKLPVILDPEKGVIAGGGEEYILKSIVDGPFAAKDWRKSMSDLNNFLNIRHSQAVESRARFYLGEAYYFSGDYRNSFLQFLFVENALYTETQPWMDALFAKLETQPGQP
jgi:hypothetical protein